MKTNMRNILLASLALCIAGSVFPHTARSASAEQLVVEKSAPCALLADMGIPDDAYVLKKVLPVAYGTIYKFGRVEGGIPVFGEELIISCDAAGRILFRSGDFSPLDVDLRPELSAKEAEAVAAGYGGTVLSCSPVIYENTLAYDISSTAEGGMRLFVSAEDGETLLCAPETEGIVRVTTQTNADGKQVELGVEYDAKSGVYTLADVTRNIYVYDVRNGYYSMPVVPVMTSETGVFEDAMAVSAFENVVKSYDYYADGANIGVRLLGLNGGNDEIAGNADERPSEIPIQLMVHYGTDYENAAMNCESDSKMACMFIGDGKVGGAIDRPARALDIIAHEYQHGVSAFAAGFVYLNESGALNEAFSDIFGALIEGAELDSDAFWDMGESIGIDGAAFRSMKTPTEGYRYSVSEQYPSCHEMHAHTKCDYGGVHFNSTIITHTIYNMWSGAKQFFTRERIGTLCYSTLCALGEKATFDDFAMRLLEAGIALGYPEEIVKGMRGALYESGILTETDSATSSNEDDILFVRFVNGEEVLKLVPVWRFSLAEPPAAEECMPVRPSDERYDYTFDSWEENSPFAVVEDTTVKPIFRRSTRTFKVVFYDVEGNVLSTQSIAYGDAAETPDDPTMSATDAYEYIFDGWDTYFGKVTEDLEIRPVFRESLRRYTVNYRDGTRVIQKDSAAYGEAVPLAPPAQGRLWQKFEGWYLDEALTQRAESVVATGEVDLYAKFSPDPLPIALVCAGGALLIGGVSAAVILIRKRSKK